jgi:uncharacterized protein with ATP-grasp and redox domains
MGPHPARPHAGPDSLPEAEAPLKAAAGEWRDWAHPADGVPFPLVKSFPERPGLWDLASSPDLVVHWTEIFRANGAYVREVLASDGDAREQAGAARVFAILEGLLRELEAGTAADRIRTVHEVTLVRERLLRASGIPDPYRRLKEREAALWFDPGCAALERAWALGGETGSREALAELLGDLLAGNLFDLGSHSTQQAFRNGTLDPAAARLRFRAEAQRLLARFEAEALALLLPRPRPLEDPPEGRMLLFADNAGADFLTGALPAAVFFARRWEVLLVVNSEPASSDITIAEARELWTRLAARAGSPLTRLGGAGRLRLVPSGTGSPGIDLRHVGEELSRAAQGVRWFLIEGQGRAIETNWSTRFRVPVLRAALAKDTRVAAEISAPPGSALLRWEGAALEE